MTWNFRVVKHGDPADPNDPTAYYAIHEAYYDENGVCDTVTEDEVAVSGESIEECREMYRQMAEAFDLPVLDFETLNDVNDVSDV